MFKKGDYIVYGSTGICVIEDITTMDLPGVTKERLYYVMLPYGKNGNKIFTPVDNPKMKLRRVLTKEETLALIDEIPAMEQVGISEEKLREQKYKEYLRSCECKNWIRMIKTLYHRNQERISQGKKVTATDERYFKLAEENLYTEFSISLDIPKDKIQEYIEKRLNKESVKESTAG
ncbi:MAG: CarD family transcriptional regulator [Lachnospiraceae bacterium]|nr:CarD family transcriptional regulator [Lachnospiraceae bacterium]